VTAAAQSLGEALPVEIARVSRLAERYAKIGPSGAAARALMRQDVDRACRAIAEQDIVEMLRAYASLRDWQE
jgi:hypothetical protein